MRSMSHPFRTMTFVGTAIALAACTTKTPQAMDSAAATATPATSNAAADSAAKASAASIPAPVDPAHFTDANILAKEAAGDSAEVEVATLAKSMATSAAVKAYAEQLLSDHSKGLSETHALATSASISPELPAGDTTALATSHVIQRLQAIPKGGAFDTAFVNHEVEDHKSDIEEAHAMSGAAQNAKVKAFVEKSVPELQKHLDKAQKLAASTRG